MKTKFTNIACGLTTASIFALALTACDDNSPSAPTDGDVNSSAIESTDTSSSSNGDVPPESSNGTPTSSETPASSANEPASSGNDVSSSSTIIEVSSSSKIASSSSLTLEACIDMDQMCPPCVKVDGGPSCPLTNNPCNQCRTEGATAKSCKGGLGYVCSDGLWKQIKGDSICDPGGDCDGDGIPDGIYRPDLEPCAVEDSTMEFYNRIFTCKEGKWVYTPDPDDTDPHREAATDAKAEHRGGPAVTPIVVKVKNADGTVTIRDDGADIYDFDSVTVGAELAGDTLIAHVEFSDPTKSSFVMGTLTFTVSNAFADINYLKYDFRGNVKPVHEVEELLPCGNNSSCVECPPDQDCGGVAW